MKESNYIRWRKLKAFGNSLAFYLCRLFPIHKHRICISTFEGKGGFGCNPKYIVQELHRRHPDYEFIWLVKDGTKEFPPYIKKEPYTVWGRAYWMSTAKVWIDNYRTHYGVKKRAGQYYLNTNHYTEGIKCTGLLRGEGFSRMAYLVSKADSDQMDALVTDSRWCDAVMPDSMLFHGRMLKTGAPRCDILYGDRREARRRIREKHGLPQDAHIVMYAPTFREGAKNGKRSVYSEVWSLDFARLLEALEAKFGGKWYLCLRVHPQLAPTFRQYKNEALSGRVFDESQTDDMYKVLAGMDFYITDYSSAIFEAGFAGIPAFIYANDIAQYAHDRGALMWNLATDPHERVRNNKNFTPQFDLELPFPVASDNEELLEKVVQFDFVAYQRTMRRFTKSIDLVFDGKASERIVDSMEINVFGVEQEDFVMKKTVSQDLNVSVTVHNMWKENWEDASFFLDQSENSKDEFTQRRYLRAAVVFYVNAIDAYLAQKCEEILTGKTDLSEKEETVLDHLQNNKFIVRKDLMEIIYNNNAKTHQNNNYNECSKLLNELHEMISYRNSFVHYANGKYKENYDIAQIRQIVKNGNTMIKNTLTYLGCAKDI